MKSNKFNHLSVVAVAISAALLSACGGGGGGSATLGTNVSAPPAAVTPTPVVLTSNIVTSAPAANYTTGSEEALAYALLNSERVACGFGALAQNTKLDDAARGHANWNQVNNYVGHYQVAGTPGFTGVSASDRYVAAGYAASAGLFSQNDDASAFFGTNTKTGAGSLAIRNLLNAPYHMRSLLAGYREVGISVRNATESGSTHGARVDTQVNPAYKSADGEQIIGTSDVVTYPCQGTTGVKPSLNNELPNPVPGRNLATNPLGSSIYIMVRPGNALVITNSSLIATASGAVIALRAPVTASNDPNTGFYTGNDAYIAADAPMTANTQYTFTYSGTNNGTVFTNRSFTFTTGT